MPVTEIGVNLPNIVGGPYRDEIVVEARPSAFAEMIDVANPLQHVPLVGDVYREMTGDKISDGARLGGHVAIGAIAGGPVGAIIGAGVFVIEKLFGGGGKVRQTEQAGFSLRSEDRAAADALARSGGVRKTNPLAAGRPQMSSSEFAALIASFQPAKPGADEKRGGDLRDRMLVNLEKMDALKTAR